MAQAQQGNFITRAFDAMRQGSNQQQQQNNNQQQNNQQQNNQQQQNQSQNNNRQQQQQQNNQNQNDLNNPENRQTPFDAYKNLWQNADTSAENPPDFKLDDKLVNTTADSIDFLKDLPKEMVEGLQTAFGDNYGVVADVLNHIGRRAYATSLNHGSLLTDKYLKVKGTFDQKGFGRNVKEHMALTGIASHEAAQKHPILRETLQMIGSKLARLHPDATPDWIRDKAFEFFKEANGALFAQPNQQQQQQEQRKAPGGDEFDWDAWAKQGKKTDNL